jgi:hypothetical protein
MLQVIVDIIRHAPIAIGQLRKITHRIVFVIARFSELVRFRETDQRRLTPLSYSIVHACDFHFVFRPISYPRGYSIGGLPAGRASARF